MKSDNAIYTIYTISMRFFNILSFSDLSLEFCASKANRIFHFTLACGHLHIAFGFVKCLLVNFLNYYCFELIISTSWELHFLN